MSQPAFHVLPDRTRSDRYVVVNAARELGRFSLSGLRCDESAGRRLAAAIGGPRQSRFPGPHGLVHDVTLARATSEDLEALFAAIAGRALARMYGAVFVCGADGLAPALRVLGVERPDVLAATGIAPVIGVFEPGAPSVLARVRAAAA